MYLEAFAARFVWRQHCGTGVLDVMQIKSEVLKELGYLN